MQREGSQEGMSIAMLRFSYWVVPLGNVPSSGRHDAGRLSPSRTIMGPRTAFTNSGASSATGGLISNFDVAFLGTFTS